MKPAEKARRLLRRCRFGALATLSQRIAGHPFASIAPYVPDHEGHPVILISALAEHTKNLQEDARVSLLVHAEAEDVLSAARVTCVGRGQRLEEPFPELKERYLRYIPQAAPLLGFGDFAFYRIEPLALHWIGGFGDIQWIPAEAYRPPSSDLAKSEADIIAHMNADHAAAMRDYCRFVHQREVLDVELAGVDCDGFDVRADGALLRFDFEAPALSPAWVRTALVDLARRARA